MVFSNLALSRNLVTVSKLLSDLFMDFIHLMKILSRSDSPVPSIRVGTVVSKSRSLYLHYLNSIVFRAASSLSSISSPLLQPFDAHVPFHLQFAIDHSIFGMDFVSVRNARFRLKRSRCDDGIKHIFHDRNHF